MAKQKEKKRRKNRKKTTRLNKRQRKFVNAILDPDVDTVSEATRIAGYADVNTGYRSLKKPAILGALDEFLQSLTIQGATDPVVARRIAEGLHAKVVRRFAHNGKIVSVAEDITRANKTMNNFRDLK